MFEEFLIILIEQAEEILVAHGYKSDEQLQLERKGFWIPKTSNLSYGAYTDSEIYEAEHGNKRCGKRSCAETLYAKNYYEMTKSSPYAKRESP